MEGVVRKAGKQAAPVALALVVLLLAALAPVARAYSTVAGLSASDYATGFSESPTDHWGPLGLGFDQSDNLYVVDSVDSSIYRFQPGGGQASPATRLNSTPLSGVLTGLAVGRDGSIYVARYKPGDVIQIDPGTGSVLRTVASVPCATGLAVDPVSGDLFVSQDQCGSTIYRMSAGGGGSGGATAFAHAPGVDGLAFDASGTLYAESNGEILKIQGTNGSAPGSVSQVASVPRADGLAFGARGTGPTPYLVVNGNDGVVTKVDFSQQPPATEQLFTGGSRGDFAAVDSNGCLYITQSSSIVRVAPTNGSCALQPSTPGAGGGPSSAPPPAVAVTQLSSRPEPGQRKVTPTSPTGKRSCARTRRVTLRLSQKGRVRLRSATIYVNGRKVAQLRGNAVQARFTLSKLPAAPFTLKVVALTTKGKRLVTQKRYSALCPVKPPPPRCVNASRLKLGLPQHNGTRITSVTSYVNGRSQGVTRGKRLTSVTVSGLHGPFRVKLAIRYASGATSTLTRNLLGCPAQKPRKPIKTSQTTKTTKRPKRPKAPKTPKPTTRTRPTKPSRTTKGGKRTGASNTTEESKETEESEETEAHEDARLVS